MIYYYILTSIEVDLDLSLCLDTSTLSYQLPLVDKMLLKVFLSAFSVFIALFSSLFFFFFSASISGLAIHCLYFVCMVVLL